MDEIIRSYRFKCRDEKDTMELADRIHEQLSGNVDYINDNIVLNIMKSKNVVRVFIFEECTYIPRLDIW